MWTGVLMVLLNSFLYFHADHPGLFPAPDCLRNKISNWYGLSYKLLIHCTCRSLRRLIPAIAFLLHLDVALLKAIYHIMIKCESLTWWYVCVCGAGGACMYNMYMHTRQVVFCMHAWLYIMHAWTIHLVLACIHEIMCLPATMISDIFKQVYTRRRFKIKIHILKLPFIDHWLLLHWRATISGS